MSTTIPSSLVAPRRICAQRLPRRPLVDEACCLDGFDLSNKRGKTEATVHSAGDGSRDATLPSSNSSRTLGPGSVVSSVPATPRHPRFRQRQPLSRSLSALCRRQVCLRRPQALRLSSWWPRPAFQNRGCQRWPCGLSLSVTLRPGHALLLPLDGFTQRTCLSYGCAPESPKPTASLPSPITTSGSSPSKTVDDVTRFARLCHLLRLLRHAPDALPALLRLRSLLAAGHRRWEASPLCTLRVRTVADHRLVFSWDTVLRHAKIRVPRWPHPRPSNHDSLELPCYECGHTFPTRHALSMHAVHAHAAPSRVANAHQGTCCPICLTQHWT